MCRLVIGLCLLVGLLTLAVTAALAFGQRMKPWEWPALTECESMCWEGIQPDHTSFEEAVRRLRTSRQVNPLSLEIRVDRRLVAWTAVAAGDRFPGYLIADGDVVRYVSARIQQRVTVGEAFTLLGHPDSVQVCRVHNRLVFYILRYSGHRLLLWVAYDPARFQFYAGEVSSISLYGVGTRNAVLERGFEEWRGPARPLRYHPVACQMS